jgi:hypothetical protein
MNDPIPPEAVATITEEGARGREAWKRGAIGEAETHFLNAWSALPEPKLEKDYAQSLSRGLTVFFTQTKQFEKAKQWLQITREAYGRGPNASVDFLAATVDFESGDLDAAFRLFDELFVQYGSRPFQGKDPRYLDFYTKRAQARR